MKSSTRTLARYAAGLGLFLGLSVAGAGELPAVDLARATEISAARCGLCHGVDGDSSSPLYPRLASQHHQYIAKQLADFKAGRRKSDTMASMAADLAPDEMLALGVYFEQKPTKPRPARDVELAGVGRYIFHRGNESSGVAACAGCHGENGHGTDQLPRLAGQVARYIEEQLRSFNKRERTNDNAIMHSIASKLTELEIRGVAMYISALE
ncbi:MAG: cytochrome c4 [Thauera sp.]|nr:cytochrome c4 [Thauera sp.]